MTNKYDKQGRSIAETLFDVVLQDKKLSEGQKLSMLFSTKERLKAAKAAYEGKQVVGTIVNATTDFQKCYLIL